MWRRSFVSFFGTSNSTKLHKILLNQTLLINSKVKHKYQRLFCTQKYETKKKFTDNATSAYYNSFTYRSHTCGELRPIHVGQKVILCGWVQYVRLSKFLLLRDSYGLTQCILSEHYNVNNLPLETIVKVIGVVAKRPANAVNDEMSTGEVEVVIDKLEILNEVSKLPFNLRNYQKPKEQLRLQHRYIDLRFPEMQYNLRQRSKLLHNMRKFLVDQHNFVEVETPTLFCRTPGGAREFVVPTHHSGLFYSLVQSPQQFKQMLMSGGIDRYFQIARCYRNETTRPDRQPEFTQLDLELSFVNMDGILNMIELLLQNVFIDLSKSQFKRITYFDALENYGSDKPNLTYDLKLKNLNNIFDPHCKAPNFGVYGLPYPSKLGKLTAKYKHKTNELRNKYNVRIILNENIEKETGDEISQQIKSIIGTEFHMLLCLGDRENVCLCLGEMRETLASVLKSKDLIIVKDSLEPLWVVDFPLFTKDEEGLQPCHHPFTAPHPDDFHLLNTDPLKVRSLAYDIVLNGNEIGGGSVRIHNADLQERILDLLNIESSSLAHFINALKSGCPPHAGIALGIDRLMAVVCKAESIRDVIAFPKTHEGKDPLSGAPNKINDADQKYYHIRSC